MRVITRAVYRQDNEGYIDPKHPAHIWMVSAPRSAEEKVKPRQLTTGRFDEDNAIWSKDGSQIYFTRAESTNHITNCRELIFIPYPPPAVHLTRSQRSI